MAALDFRTATSGSLPASSPAVVPKPAGVFVGDLLIVAIFGTSSGTWDTPSGWTFLGIVDTTGGTGEGRIRFYGKQVASGDGASYSFTHTGSAGSYFVLAYEKALAGSALFGSVWDSTTDTAWTVPALTTTEEARRIGIAGSGFATSATPPAGWTARSTGTAQYGVGDVLVATGVQAAATFTGQASNSWGVSIAVYRDNVAPNAPNITTMTGGTTVNLADVNRADWDFSDADAGDSQSKFDLDWRDVGAGSWTTVTQTTPNTFYDFAAGTFTTGDKEWRVRTYDSLGFLGPYSASSFFTASSVATDLSITAPTNGATISTETHLVEWSTPVQTHYQVRVVADLAGAPDTSDVIYDSGEVESAAARSLLVSYPTNGVTRHTQVRKKSGGLWTAWVSVSNPISYTAPATPTITVQENTPVGAISVQATHPAPSGLQPAVSSMQVYRRETSESGDGIRVATDLAALAIFEDWMVASGAEYAYRVKAVGANGTSAFSAWSEDGSGTVEPAYYGGTYPDGMYGSEGGGY